MPEKSAEIYNSTYLNSEYNLPKERRELNSHFRVFTATQKNVIDNLNFFALLAKYIKFSYSSNEEFWKNQIQKLHLIKDDLLNKDPLLEQVIKDYVTFGECFIYLELDEKNLVWRNAILQNPDYVIVKKSSITEDIKYFLRPDEKLRNLVLKNNPNDEEKRSLMTLDKNIINCIKNGENIPLNDFYFSALINRTNPYEVRGSSEYLPILKTLLLLDRIIPGTDINYINYLQNIIKSYLDPFYISEGFTLKVDAFHSKILRLSDKLKYWIEEKVFEPIAKLNKFDNVPHVSFDVKKMFDDLKQNRNKYICEIISCEEKRDVKYEYDCFSNITVGYPSPIKYIVNIKLFNGDIITAEVSKEIYQKHFNLV